jgi:hypothetical protein
MVGYADDHPSDCYGMYNPTTDRVVISRDIKWTKWIRADPTATLKQMQEAVPPTSSDNTKVPIAAPLAVHDSSQTAHLTNPHEPPSDGPHLIPDDDFDAGRIYSHAPDSDRPRTRSQTRQTLYETASGRPRTRSQQLDTHFDTRPDEVIEQQGGNIVEDDEDENERDNNNNHINMVMSLTMSDPGEPKNLEEALSGQKGEEWKESVKSEINNFIQQDAWKKVSLQQIMDEGRRPIRTKTVFKIKDEHDGTQQLKSRIVTLGYSMIPGQDYTDSFSPVATDASIRTVFVVSLYIMNQSRLRERIKQL